MCEINEKFLMPKEFLEQMKTLLPNSKKSKVGRPRMEDLKALQAIFYVLRTGIQWNALPRCLGAASTVHDRFQFWRENGVFFKLWQKSLEFYNDEKSIDWEWQSMDGCHVLAPLGGSFTGPSYKHRGKTGSNRSLITETNGIPIGIVVAPANCNDFKLAESTLRSIAVDKPDPESLAQHICLDKGYDYSEIDLLVEEWGYVSHIRRKGEDKNIACEPLYKPRRWVVERAHAWMNNFRKLMIRWAKKAINYLAFLHLACAWITYKRAGLF